MWRVNKQLTMVLLAGVAVAIGTAYARGYEWVWAHNASGSGNAQIFDGGGVVYDADSTTSPTDEWMRFSAFDGTSPGPGQTGFRVDGDSKVNESPVALELLVSIGIDYSENDEMPFGGTGDGGLSSTFELVMPLDTLEWSYYLWQRGIGYDAPLSSSATAVVENVTQGLELLNISSTQVGETTLSGAAGDLIRMSFVMSGGGTVAGGSGEHLSGWVSGWTFTLPDCNANGLPDFEDVSTGLSPDCNANGVPDECDTAEGTSEDCNFDSVPDECQPDEDCNNNSVRDICDIGAGTSPDCNENLVPDECDDCNNNGVADPEDISQGTSTDCDQNCIPDDCDFVDCNTNGIFDGCDIAEGTSFDLNDNGVPDECDPLVPPSLPALEEHQARKNRYVSIDPGSNGANPVGLKVTLTSMKRCAGAAQGHRSCRSDDDCPTNVCDNDPFQGCSSDTVCGTGRCVQSGPCAEHPDVGLTWWVQEPQQNPAGCIPACTDEDWYARVDPDNMVFRVWTLDTLHIGDCEIVPVATYELRACLPPDGGVCSDPLTIGTIHKPGSSHYGDVAGGPPGFPEDPDRFTPPDGWVSLPDLYAYLFTKTNYGTGQDLMAHPTWVDLEGEGSVPQYVINAADLLQIEMAMMPRPYTKSTVNRQPGECNPVCPNARCDVGETPCNCPPDCGSAPAVEVNCDDVVDEDCDGLIDCEDEDCAADLACTSPRDRVAEWVPVNPPALAGNAVTVQAGTQVTLHLKVSGWDPNLDGDPKIGAFQARVDSGGYSSGEGAPLNPVGHPEMEKQGAFIAYYVCASDDENPADTFDPMSVCGNSDDDCPPTHPFCVARPDMPFYLLTRHALVSTATLDYTWEAASAEGCDYRADDGEAKYGGTLVLEIPPDAAGTYTIGFNTDANQTFFTDCGGAPIPGLTTVPAQITVCPEGTLTPAIPADPEQQARKNRYVSVSPAVDYACDTAIQVTLSSMKRCSDDLGRTCRTAEDCPPGTGSCAEHPEVGSVLGWVGEPDANGVSRVVSDPLYRVWIEPTVHLGDCEIVPVATYEFRATLDGGAFTDPLEVGTILKPGDRHYGDVVGTGTGDYPPLPGFTPPNAVVNVSDIQAVLLTIQGPLSPSTHPTWVDLHGLGDGVPPNFILNVSDLQRVLWGIDGQEYLDSPEHLGPGACP